MDEETEGVLDKTRRDFRDSFHKTMNTTYKMLDLIETRIT
jgi:hypothetical protein